MLDNPAAYDIINKLCAAWRKEYVPVAQLDRVSDSDSEGRWFESSRVHEGKPLKSKDFSGFSFSKHVLLVPSGSIY